MLGGGGVEGGGGVGGVLRIASNNQRVITHDSVRTTTRYTVGILHVYRHLLNTLLYMSTIASMHVT